MDLEQNIDGGVSPDSLPPINNSPNAAVVPGLPLTQTQAGAGQSQTASPKQIVGQLAGYGARFLATIIDGILLGIVQFIVGLAFTFGPMTFLRGQSLALLMVLPLIQFLLQIMISIYYYGIYQHNTGQTIGKKAMGIKVVDMVTGQTPSVGKFLLRDMVGKILSSLILMIGYLMPLWDEKKQALHDKIAGTVVIRV